MNANYVSVGNLPRRKQFLLEARQDCGVLGHLGANQFQRDNLIDFAIDRFVNRAHPAFAQYRENFKALAKHIARLEPDGLRENI